MNLSAALQADVFNETPIKVILFDGTKKQWLIWMEKFMARAARKGYKSLHLKMVLIKVWRFPKMMSRRMSQLRR